jgi:predicted Abi (CAAX) family protease
MSNTHPTKNLKKNRGWTQVLAMGKKFLLLIRHRRLKIAKEQSESVNRMARFIPVSDTRTNKLYIFRQYTYIIQFSLWRLTAFTWVLVVQWQMIFLTFDFIHLSTRGTMTNDIFDVWLYSFEYSWYNDKWFFPRLV